MARKKIEIGKLKPVLEKLKEQLSIEDWILIALYSSPKKSYPSEIYIQKFLFLAQKYLKNIDIEFQPYRLGPYSPSVKDSIDILISENSIKKDPSGELKLSQKGLKKAENRFLQCSDKERELLSELGRFIYNMSEDELLLYTYIVHGYKEKSDIINKLLQRRIPIAISLVRKNLVSISLAAKIAGMSLQEFIKFLKKKGIKPYIAEVEDIDKASSLGSSTYL